MNRYQPRIIGLTGHFGSGKDAIGALLHMVGYERRAFANAIRDEVLGYLLGVDGSEVDPALLAPIQEDLYVATREEVYGKPTSPAMRRILQFWGAELRRSQNENYWVEAMLEEELPEWTVITDVHFPNEVKMIRDLGGEIWYVTREGAAGNHNPHVSERLVDEIIPDLFIHNNDTLYHLAGRVMHTLYAGKPNSAGELKPSGMSVMTVPHSPGTTLAGGT